MPDARRSTVPSRTFALGVAAPLACALAALVCLRIGWWVLFQARIGPVVATLTGSHGVHSGDVIGVGSVAVGLALAAGAYALARRPAPVVARVSAR